MTVRVFMTLKRKPGMTPEAFRQEYETGHSRLALKLFGHLWKEYRRSYLQHANNFLQAEDSGTPVSAKNAQAPELPYDVITEIVYEDISVLDEMNRIAAENRELLAEDEKRLFERKNCWIVITETLEENLTPYARTK